MTAYELSQEILCKACYLADMLGDGLTEGVRRELDELYDLLDELDVEIGE